MNRLLILLCMVWWALYIIHTNSAAGGGDVLPARAFAVSSPSAEAAATSQQAQLRPIASAEVESPHAITPDETPPQKGTNVETPAPQTEASRNPEPLPESSQDSGTKPDQEREELRVASETSIRSGPSASAQLIGRAHVGATLRVKSRDRGWVEFVDPVANETGWISMAYLEPINAVGNTPQPPKSTKLRSPRPMPKVARLKSPKPEHRPAPVMRSPTYAQVPADREFVPAPRSGLFGLFWRRRLSGD
jgi:SH3 domain-containing protein